MWAYRSIAPSSLVLAEVVQPDSRQLGPGQVLLRTLAGGICGSDLPYFRGQPPLLSLPGVDPAAGLLPAGFPMHEVVGEVVASRDPDLTVGTTVVGWAAAMNGLAELVVACGSMLAVVPHGVPPVHAITAQPLACVIEAVSRLGDVGDRRAAVLGLGPIGLLFAHVLSCRGAVPVVGVDRVDRSDIASDFGLDEVVHASAAAWVAVLDPEHAPEIVVEAIGHQVGTLATAVEAAAPNGRLLYFGIPDDPVYPLPMSLFVRKALTLVAGTTRERRSALVAATEHLAARPGLAETYVTDIFPRDRANDAYLAAAAPEPGRLKVVIDLS